MRIAVLEVSIITISLIPFLLDSGRPVRPPRPQQPPQQRHTEQSDLQDEDEDAHTDDPQQPIEDIASSVKEASDPVSRKPMPPCERPSRPARPPPHSRPRRQDTTAHQEEQENHSPAHHDRSREKLSPRPSRPPPPKLVSSASVSQSTINLPPQRPPRPSLPPRGRSATTINVQCTTQPVQFCYLTASFPSLTYTQVSPVLLPRTNSAKQSPVPAPRILTTHLYNTEQSSSQSSKCLTNQ